MAFRLKLALLGDIALKIARYKKRGESLFFGIKLYRGIWFIFKKMD